MMARIEKTLLLAGEGLSLLANYSSLRRHYPDQVRRVEGKFALLSAILTWLPVSLVCGQYNIIRDWGAGSREPSSE
jgi:hypothetical protein